MVRITSRLWLLLTCASILTLLASPGFSSSTSAKPAGDDGNRREREEHSPALSHRQISPAVSASKRGGMVSYQPPRETLLGQIAREKLGPNASQTAIEASSQDYLSAWSQGHYHGPDLKANERLQRNEQRALAAGSSPAAMGLAVTGTLRLLAIAVEFNGSDKATNFSHPVSVSDRTCITETLTLKGPLHNQIPEPGPRDNATLWRPKFESDYYEKMVFSKEGVTDRVRPDLTDPEDGKPGIDISGQTMHNYYEEISDGRVKFDGGPKGVIAWVKVPHSEAYYGASACTNGEAGDIADMQGLPSNPRFGNGPPQLIIDAASAINKSDPNFPWSDYDTDGDGRIDHLVLFHAGKDKSSGGGQQTWQALWAHRGFVDPEAGGYVVDNGGTPDPKDDIKVFGYTLQYEDVEAGVLVHEFGHDLGLPDLYDTTRGGESSVVWWDLMDGGELTGKLIGTHPTHMSAWSKFALGWTDPKVITPTAEAQDIELGQTSHPPEGTEQSLRINLPANKIVHTELLPGSTQAWWTNNDQDWADVRLSRDIDLRGKTGPISITFDLDSITEEDWDYLFLEVSQDAGATYTQTKGFEVGTNIELTTPDDYPDPNGRLGDYGDLVHGYTGEISAKAGNPEGTWVHAYHDLSAYAGKQIKLRFRYATDAAFVERGAFIDNISVHSKTATILNDPVEGGNLNGWTPTVGTFAPGEALGKGWVLSDGTQSQAEYYLVEWRNTDGFDKGLLYTYHTVFAGLTNDGREDFHVDHIPTNVPGMLVYLRDTRFGNDPFGASNAILDPTNQLVAMPSEGPKGGLLVVDANYEPIRGPLNGTVTTPFGTFAFPPNNNWNSRVQATNSAFNLQGTPPITLTHASDDTNTITTTAYAHTPGISSFHDALGYYPGVEKLPQPIVTFQAPGTLRLKPYALKQADSSVVIPAKGYYPPRTPAGFTGKGGETSPPSNSISTFETVYEYPPVGGLYPISIGEAGGLDISGQHSGNPGSDNLQYGNHFRITYQDPAGTYATLRLWSSQFAADQSGDIVAPTAGNAVQVNVGVKNTGSPAYLAVYSDFDESRASYVERSATNGAVPVRESAAEVSAVLREKGPAGLNALRVAASEAIAVVWTSQKMVDTGADRMFSYKLRPQGGYHSVKVINTVFGPGFSDSDTLSFGSDILLPVVPR